MSAPTPDSWLTELKRLDAEARAAAAAAGSADALEAVRVKFLGRQGGAFSELFKRLKDLTLEQRKLVGPEANALKDALVAALDARHAALAAKASSEGLAKERIDCTLPAPDLAPGRLHPITQTMREMTAILSAMGFSTADGPLVEEERYNFDDLNIPAGHPARDMQDTFYLAGPAGPSDLLLRTHTSPVQVRYMKGHRPPIRVIAPGRVFRHEATDASHSAVFHQVEGLYVDAGVGMADLKGTLSQFFARLLGPRTETRFRPSYFPFVEPGAEVDVRCLLCKGAGCPACKRSGWMEMLGCGMVHPRVLRAGGQDPEKVSGFAFGMGVERLAMVRLGIPDIRLLYENDLRFLEQFA